MIFYFDNLKASFVFTVHEETSISESRISQGMLLVLEPGPAPASDEVKI